MIIGFQRLLIIILWTEVSAKKKVPPILSAVVMKGTHPSCHMRKTENVKSALSALLLFTSIIVVETVLDLENAKVVLLEKKHVKMLPKFNVVYKHLYTMIGQMQIIMHLSIIYFTQVPISYTTACFRTVKLMPTYTRRNHFKHIQLLNNVGVRDVAIAIRALNEPVVLG